MKPWNKGKFGYHLPLHDGGYRAIHKWLECHFGKADRCENPGCERRFFKFNWAKKKDSTYEHKRENFWRLCIGCHRRYDHTPQWAYNTGKACRGKFHTKAHKRAIAHGCKGIHIGNKYGAKKNCTNGFGRCYLVLQSKVL